MAKTQTNANTQMHSHTQHNYPLDAKFIFDHHECIQQLNTQTWVQPKQKKYYDFES